MIKIYLIHLKVNYIYYQMKPLNKDVVKSILCKFPRTNIKNLNIYSQSSNNKVLFNSNSKYYILKSKGRKSYLWFTYFEKKFR